MNGTHNQPFSQTLTATGGSSPYTWAESGTWPSWLSLNTSTGKISGTPPTAGTYTFTVSVTCSGASGSQSLTLTVN